jgi:FAD/FMN-containing dehydrogenase
MTTGALHVDLPGEVIRPGDATYDRLRAVFNGMIDRRPLAVLRCRDTAEVARGVAFAREHDLPLSIRGGGHNVAGHAVCDDGIMLDLSRRKDLRADPDRRIAQAGPGLTLGQLDRGTQQHGLATPLGVVSPTGIAGLTLGGGLGWLNGKHGLTCDNLLSADVVTANGEVIRASAEDNADLFWALRGGGNFGVVTSFIYRLHPVGPVLAGGLSHPWTRVREALRFHHDFMAAAPDELSTAVSLALDPTTGAPVITIAVCYCGPHDEGERVLRPLRAFGPPLDDTIAPVPYLAWQSARRQLPARPAALLEGRLVAAPDRRGDRDHRAVPPADPVSHQRPRAATHGRRGKPRRTIRHRLRPARRAVRLPHPVPMAEPQRLRAPPRMDPGVLHGHAATPGKRRLRQQPWHRGSRTRSRGLRGQLPTARRTEADVRPLQRVPAQPKHRPSNSSG